MRFIIENPEDEIQRYLISGKFYEENELKFIKSISKEGWNIIDVGANVGNHTIFFQKFLNPKNIWVFEPNADSYKILLQNIALNYCHNVNVDYINLALGNKNAKYSIIHFEQNNLGATTLGENSNGTIECVTGDSIFKNKIVDFIKIDVEGMELEVLYGFVETILKNKPIIYVEILNSNFDKFLNFVESIDYKITHQFRMYNHNANYLIVDKKCQTDQW